MSVNSEPISKNPERAEPEKKISRRKFLQTTLKAAFTGAILNIVGGGEPLFKSLGDVLKNLAEKDIASVNHFMVDYVAEPTLTEPLMNELATETIKTIPDLIAQIKGIPDFKPSQDKLIGSLLEFKRVTKDITPSAASLQQLMDVTKPIIAALIDETLFVVGQDHGKFVEGIFKDQLAALESKKPKDETNSILALQAFLSEVRFTADEVGNVSVGMFIDAASLIKVIEQVYQRHPDQRKVTTVSTMAFNFGEVNAKIALFETPKIGDIRKNSSDVLLTEVVNDATGESEFFLPYPNNFNDYLAAYAQADQRGDVTEISSQLNSANILKSGSKSTTFEAVFRYEDGTEVKVISDALKIELSDSDLSQKEKDKEATTFLQKKVQDFLAVLPTTEARLAMHVRLQKSGLISTVTNYKDAITYHEPYLGEKSSENFQGFVDFCGAFPNILAVHAGGNNSDIRAITARPENGLVSSSVNAAGAVRFGRDGKIGCLGADIYLVDEDFIADGQYNVFSTSQTVGILSAYAEQFASKGLLPQEIRKVILELCTETTEIVHNQEISVADAKVFKPELATAALARNAEVLRQAIQTF